MAGRPRSLRAVREQLFLAMRLACAPWRANYLGRAPKNEEAENAFLRVVGAWESFLSDWAISSVVRDPTVLVTKLNQDLEEWVARRYGMSRQELLQSGMSVALRANLTLGQPSYEDVRKLLDARGRNIDFDSLTQFSKYIKDLAAKAYANRASAAVPQHGAANDGIVEAATALRNWLTHGSLYSRETLKAKLGTLNHPELACATLPTSGGRYLKEFHLGPDVQLADSTSSAKPVGTNPAIQYYERRRILLYCAEFARVAWSLAPIEET